MILIPLSFRKWCEKNGYRHTGHATYAEFERRAKQYDAYCAAVDARAAALMVAMCTWTAANQAVS